MFLLFLKCLVRNNLIGTQTFVNQLLSISLIFFSDCFVTLKKMLDARK